MIILLPAVEMSLLVIVVFFLWLFILTCLTIFLITITVLEVYQFARDAAVAEGWLMAQENYLTSHELGVSCCFTFLALFRIFKHFPYFDHIHFLTAHDRRSRKFDQET